MTDAILIMTTQVVVINMFIGDDGYDNDYGHTGCD